jgi:WD40 repeat protein
VRSLSDAEIQALAECFPDAVSARRVLSNAGLSASRHPSWQVRHAFAFWSEVAALLDGGALEGGRQALLAEALKWFPGNRLFVMGVRSAYPEPVAPDTGGSRTPPGNAILEIRQLVYFRDRLRSLSFLPDNATLATVDHGSNVRLWDFNTGAGIETYDIAGVYDGPRLLEFCPDGSVLAVSVTGIDGQRDKRIEIWDVLTGKRRQVLNVASWLFAGSPMASAFSSDGETLAVSDGFSIRLWVRQMVDDTVGRPAYRRRRGRLGSGQPIALSLEGELLATATTREIELWEIGDRRLMWKSLAKDHRFGPWGTVNALAFSPDGYYLAAGGSIGERGEEVGFLWLWRVDSGRLDFQFDRNEPIDIVTSLAYSSDASMIATSGASGYVQLWDTSSGREIHRSRSYDASVQSVAFSPDSATLAVGAGKMVQLWRVGRRGT